MFCVASRGLATSMRHNGDAGHPDVQKTIDGALTKIVQAGREAGTLVNAGNVEHYTRMGVRVVFTSFFPWIQAGAKELVERAAAGARGRRAWAPAALPSSARATSASPPPPATASPRAATAPRPRRPTARVPR